MRVAVYQTGQEGQFCITPVAVPIIPSSTMRRDELCLDFASDPNVEPNPGKASTGQDTIAPDCRYSWMLIKHAIV